jgi:hypothetical protein
MRQSLVAKAGNACDSYAISYDQALRGAILLRYPRQLAEVLSSSLSTWLGVHADLSDLSINIRRYKAGRRCVFQLDLNDDNTTVERKQHRQVIAKIYANTLGEKVYDSLQLLWSHGFASGHFKVPQPLAYDSDWRLLIMGQAKGESLENLLLKQLNASKAITAAAEWLVKLHKCQATERRCHTFDRLHKLGMWQRYLRVVYPEAEPLLAAIRRRLDMQRGALCEWQSALTHSDYSPDHLIIDNDKITAVDFDEFGQYDPLFDVAHFVVHLRYLALIRLGSLHRLDELSGLFQDKYRSCVEDYSVKRVRFYMVIVYLKLVYINAFNRQTQNWRNIVDILLREARQII